MFCSLVIIELHASVSIGALPIVIIISAWAKIVTTPSPLPPPTPNASQKWTSGRYVFIEGCSRSQEAKKCGVESPSGVTCGDPGVGRYLLGG
jgi:hypothetical protein